MDAQAAPTAPRRWRSRRQRELDVAEDADDGFGDAHAKMNDGRRRQRDDKDAPDDDQEDMATVLQRIEGLKQLGAYDGYGHFDYGMSRMRDASLKSISRVSAMENYQSAQNELFRTRLAENKARLDAELRASAKALMDELNEQQQQQQQNVSAQAPAMAQHAPVPQGSQKMDTRSTTRRFKNHGPDGFALYLMETWGHE